MFWFDKKNPNAIYIDKRRTRRIILTNGQKFKVDPDLKMDFRNMKFPNNKFHLVVFDPPHSTRAGKTGWLATKYGSLDKESWQEDLSAGFSECFRVLKKNGVLIFKWNEMDVPLKKVLELTPIKPLFGNRSGKSSQTHWVVFMKL